MYLLDNTKEEYFGLDFERPSLNHWLLNDLTVAKKNLQEKGYLLLRLSASLHCKLP